MLQSTLASETIAYSNAAAPWSEAGGAYAEKGAQALDENLAIARYVPLVKAVVRQLSSQAQGAMDVQDMTQVGLMGLLEALRRYGGIDESFVGYARQRIRGAILDELRRQDWRPRTVRQSAHKARDAVRSLRRELGAEPTAEQIQFALGMDDAAYLAYEQAESAEAMASLDELLGQGLDVPCFELDPGVAVIRRRTLEQVLGQLAEREQRVIQLYYEFDLSLKEIAAVLELSEARVCQINKDALRKMRAALQGG